MATKEIKPGLYIITGSTAGQAGNVTVRVAPDGVIVVDTKNIGEGVYAALMDQIKAIAPGKAVKYAVVTHVHQDHAGNIQQFVDSGAQVYAHENLKKNLETYTSAAGKVATPNMWYAKDQVLKVGNVEARVYHFDNGHTSGDSMVYFPDLKVVAAGDAFAGNMNCDTAQGGSVLGWAKSLDALLKLDFDMIVPGHGNDPLTKADVQAAQTRFAKIGSVAIDLVKKGTPKEQLMAQIAAADSTLNAGGLLQNNAARIDAFYAEIVAAAK